MSYENLSDESSDVRKLTFTTSRRKGHLVGAYASFRDSEGKKYAFFVIMMVNFFKQIAVMS